MVHKNTMKITKINIDTLKEISKIVRKDILTSTYLAGSGHPTTCLSAVELLVSLFFNYLVFDNENYGSIYQDEFILSKGHAAPLLYSIYKHTKIIDEDLNTLRKYNSLLEGHPSVKLKGIKYATGSLGQGLSIALGAAWARKYKNLPSKVYVLVGDGELAEGSIYEAANLASFYKLSNLCVIADINRLGQSGTTMFEHNLNEYKKRFEAFDFNVISIEDGHDFNLINKAFELFINEYSKTDKPTIILAKTFKGKGVSFLEDKLDWHGKPITSKQDLELALNEIGESNINPHDFINYKSYSISNNVPSIEIKIDELEMKLNDFIKNFYNQNKEKKIATREAFPIGLTFLGSLINNLVVIDGDVKNSTYTLYFEKEYKDRFIESYIAEQSMIGFMLGLSKNGFIPVSSTFGAFLTRAYDFIRMMNYSKPELAIICGTHAGISIGEDGPSQMALEDIAAFKALFNTTVIYPSDAISTLRLLFNVFIEYLKGNLKGIVYFRTSRPTNNIIYNYNSNLKIGEASVIIENNSSTKKIGIISAGVILHEALNASKKLSQENISFKLIDFYSIKPIKNIEYLIEDVEKVVVFEEHSKNGGIGESIAPYLINKVNYFEIVAVDDIPVSGSPNDLLKHFKLDSESIYLKVKSLI
ncbi:MAG: transketolase [bacterium]